MSQRIIMRNCDIPKDKVDDLGIIVSVWLNPSVIKDDHLDHKILFEIHREAMSKGLRKAMRDELRLDRLLENQAAITHKYYQVGPDGNI